jgi:hypothetical protein
MEFNGMKEIVQSFFPLWAVVLYFWKCVLSKLWLITIQLTDRTSYNQKPGSLALRLTQFYSDAYRHRARSNHIHGWSSRWRPSTRVSCFSVLPFIFIKRFFFFWNCCPHKVRWFFLSVFCFYFILSGQILSCSWSELGWCYVLHILMSMQSVTER